MAKKQVCALIVLAVVVSLGASASLFAAIIEVDGVCTLVDAITAAETDAAVGNCPAGFDQDEIRLLVDVELTSVDNTFLGPNGLPMITSKIVIRGNHHQISRAVGADDFRIFFVDFGGYLDLIDTTVSNGSVPVNDGGAIYSRSYLALVGTTITGNTAVFGGGVNAQGTFFMSDSVIIGNAAENGGGLHTGAFSTLTIDRSVISGNSAASGDGGGLTLFRSTSNIIDSTVSGNSAMFSGGGLAITGGSANVTGCLVSNNTAGACDGGGGIAAFGTFDATAATVVNSTLSSNSAPTGGGIAAIDDAAVTLTNATVCGNTASVAGGGIAAIGIGSVYLLSSIVGHSQSGGNCEGVIDGESSLADDLTCGPLPGTLTGLDPVLADHGGPTMIHALLGGSNAIGLAGGCGLWEDQRGFSRHDGACDSGSFELSGFDPLKIFEDGFERANTSNWS